MDGPSRRVGRADVLLGLLALVTALLVARVLRNDRPRSVAQAATVTSATPPVPPATPASPLPPNPSATPAPSPAGPRALVAAYGPFALRWSGDGGCTSAETVVERSTDSGGTWTGATVPLAAVHHLALAPGGRGLAVGAGASCAPAAAATDDAGRTWVAATPERAFARWRLAGGRVMGHGGDAPAKDPCAELGPGTAAHVAEAGPDEAWVLCQRADGADRLLVRTQDGGDTWRRMAGRRDESGLAGPGSVTSLRFAGRRVGSVVISGGRCRAGEVRRTSDGGLTWRTTACPAVDEVLDAAFGDARNGLALGLHDGTVVTARTRDGGATWVLLG